MLPCAATCVLCLLLLRARAAPGGTPLDVEEFNQTWAARVEWAGQVLPVSSQTLQPPVPVPAGVVATLVLGGHSDNDEAILTLMCTGMSAGGARAYMTQTFGVAVQEWKFASPGECTVTVDNPSASPVNAFFLLSAVNVNAT